MGEGNGEEARDEGLCFSQANSDVMSMLIQESSLPWRYCTAQAVIVIGVYESV